MPDDYTASLDLAFNADMTVDVIIVGGGLVGGSLSLALANAGLTVVLLESTTPDEKAGADGWDSRIYAFAPGSVEFLRACGVWDDVDGGRVMPVEDMQIFGDDAQSELGFSAYEAGLRELAVIVENRQVQAALWRRIAGQAGIEVIAPAQCRSLDFDHRAATLELDGGRRLHARLIVGADGGNSWVRAQAGIAVDARPYAQTAVVANFETGLAHRGVARQWFRRDGILALLPLPGNRVSMVWSTRESHADELMRMTVDELAAAVAAASGDSLGALRVITPAAAFPLRLQRVQHMVKPRLALVGDAAHNVHPLAGQGVNLGFRDARELAEVLAGRGAQSDCGDFYLLRRYERARREDIAAMQAATDALQRLFNNDSAALARMRNFGLRMTNRQHMLKNLLVRHAVG
jgi:ubiquinone biosynthesis UbiH/UbiF/VisC/COQ6 family hydroxylase